MIDIKFLRENPEIVKENIKKKFQDSKLPLVDEVIRLDAESRKAKQEADDLRAARKRISKEIGTLMAQGKKEEAEAKKARQLMSSRASFTVIWAVCTPDMAGRCGVCCSCKRCSRAWVMPSRFFLRR